MGYKIVNAKDMIEDLLIANEHARDDDYYLFYLVLKSCAEKKGIDLAKVSVLDYLRGDKRQYFPTFETIRRTRQMLQAENPELRATEKVQEARADKEDEYRAYLSRY